MRFLEKWNRIAAAFRQPSSVLRPPSSALRPPPSDRRASMAFTLIEMMIVVGMLAILMGVSFSGIGQARNQARVAKANAEVRELINAWLSYEAAYDDWPVNVVGDNLVANKANLQELLGENQDNTVYLNVQLTAGEFRDPWGTPYQFRLLQETGQNPVSDTFVATITFPNRHRYVRGL